MLVLKISFYRISLMPAFVLLGILCPFQQNILAANNAIKKANKGMLENKTRFLINHPYKNLKNSYVKGELK